MAFAVARYRIIYFYVSDASCRFCLTHLLLTALIPALIAGRNTGQVVKFLLVMTLTAAICWVTCHCLVRNTFVGLFLNGRRYPIRGKTRELQPPKELRKTG